MKKRVFKFHNNKKKLLIGLIISGIIFIIVGVLLIALLSKSNKEILKDYMDSFFSLVKSGKFNYRGSIKTVLLTNLISVFVIWILGVSLIGIPVILIYFSIKAMTIGMSLSSIIYLYKLKGIFISIIYIIPSIINFGIFLILSYNSIKMSKYLYRVLFLKERNNKLVINRYINVLLILTIFIIISSIVEVFIIPSILRLFI